MTRKRPRRRIDPLLLLVSVVALGMAVTVGFQLSVHSGSGVPTIVNQALAPVIADG